mgnify:CR=1 FL=1
MDEKLGIDFIDQTIIDWNNMTNNKIEKINEELKQKGNYLWSDIKNVDTKKVFIFFFLYIIE